jgi:antitoxin component YwqK of YwqJK toxin-antitoxin module
MKTKFILVMVFLMAFVSTTRANNVDDYKKACDGEDAESCGTVPNEALGTTNNSKLNSYRSMELGTAILLFMPDKSMEHVGWDYRLDAPVIWLTDGYAYENNTGEAFRKGLMRINVDGVHSTILKKAKEELAWRVRYSTLSNPSLGVDSIELSIDGGFQNNDNCFGVNYDNCVFNPEKSMQLAGIKFKKLCEHDAYTGYELNHPDKRKTLARTVYNFGSGGESTWFEIFFSKKTNDLCKSYDEEIKEFSNTPVNKKDTNKIKQSSADVKKSELQVTTEIELKNGIAFIPNESTPFTGKLKSVLPDRVYETDYKDGKKNGLDYMKNDFQTLEHHYLNGKENGLRRSWILGKIDREENYKNDKLEGLSVLYSNGTKWLEINYKNDKQDGLKTTYYPNGQKKVEENYKNGKKISEKSFDEKESESSDKAKEVMQEIKKRCQKQMGEHGAALVKACVDLDIKALNAIGSYMEKHKSVVTRCYSQMGEHGWALVKACADQDIQAEQALERY